MGGVVGGGEISGEEVEELGAGGFVGGLAEAASASRGFPRDGDLTAVRRWLQDQRASGDDWEALEDAAIPPPSLVGSVPVPVGCAPVDVPAAVCVDCELPDAVVVPVAPAVLVSVEPEAAAEVDGDPGAVVPVVTEDAPLSVEVALAPPLLSVTVVEPMGP